MASITGTFTVANQTSADLAVGPGETANVILTKTGGTMAIRVEVREGNAWRVLATFTADTAGTTYVNDSPELRHYRLLAYSAVGTSVAYTLEDVAGETQQVWFDGAGVQVAAITDAGFSGDLVGDVTGNVTGSAATVTGAAQTAITSLGTLTALQVDNLNINGNTLSATTGAVNITPLAGSAIVLDGTVNVDAGVVTGVSDLTAATATVSTALNVTGGAGAIAGSLTTATERMGVYRTTVTFAARSLAVTDALAYAGTKVYDFPAGRIHVLSASSSIQAAIKSDPATTINASAAMDYSFGTVTASSTTLATTMVDIVPKVDIPLAATIDTLSTAATGLLGAAATFDGTITPVDVYLNVAFPTDTEIDADGTLEITGSLTIIWSNFGPV